MNPASPRIQPLHADPNFACPACQTVIGSTDRCPNCQFTGADTMAMFPGPPRQLQPVLDEAYLWDDRDLKIIGRALKRAARRFPQFHWRICSTALPPDTNLPLFGFWLLNTSPLAAGETPADRTWTVLLVVNAASREAVVVPAYAAEAWLSTNQWEKALASMKQPWKSGHPGTAVAAFLGRACDLLEGSWRAMDANSR